MVLDLSDGSGVVSCTCSASAGTLLGVGLVLFGELETDHVLGDGWVDAHGRVELLLGDAAFDGDGYALGYLASIRRQDVVADDA